MTSPRDDTPYTTAYGPIAPLSTRVPTVRTHTFGPPNVISLLYNHGVDQDHFDAGTDCFKAAFSWHAWIRLWCGAADLPERTAGFRSILSRWGGPLPAVGGHSLGAWAATIALLDRVRWGWEAPKALVAVSWPLRIRGPAPMEGRARYLLDLPADVDVLFFAGSRDRGCPLAELRHLRGRMRARSWLVVVRGADEDMMLSEGFGDLQTWATVGMVTGMWLNGRDPEKTSGTIRWYKAGRRSRFLRWKRPDADVEDDD